MTNNDKAYTLFMEARAAQLSYEHIVVFYVTVMYKEYTARAQWQHRGSQDPIIQELTNIACRLNTTFGKHDMEYEADVFRELINNMGWAELFSKVCAAYVSAVGSLPVVHFSAELPKHIESTINTINSIAGSMVLVNYTEV